MMNLQLLQNFDPGVTEVLHVVSSDVVPGEVADLALQHSLVWGRVSVPVSVCLFIPAIQEAADQMARMHIEPGLKHFKHCFFRLLIETSRDFALRQVPKAGALTQCHRIAFLWRQYGCGSKPMVPFWVRCTTHFGLF